MARFFQLESGREATEKGAERSEGATNLCRGRQDAATTTAVQGRAHNLSLGHEPDAVKSQSLFDMGPHSQKPRSIVRKL